MNFEWDPLKDRENLQKHGVSFAEAARAWLDPQRVLTVRFTRRGETVRIIGAGYWREGRTIYEQANRFRR